MQNQFLSRFRIEWKRVKWRSRGKETSYLQSNKYCSVQLVFFILMASESTVIKHIGDDFNFCVFSNLSRSHIFVISTSLTLAFRKKF